MDNNKKILSEDVVDILLMIIEATNDDKINWVKEYNYRGETIIGVYSKSHFKINIRIGFFWGIVSFLNYIDLSVDTGEDVIGIPIYIWANDTENIHYQK